MRLTVIGCGLVGRKHVELIGAHQDCSPAGICDVGPARRAIAAELDVPFYKDIGELLDREKSGVR